MKMMKQASLMSLMLFASGALAGDPVSKTSPVFADELSSLRKESIVMCSKLQKPVPPEQQQALLTEMDSVISHWNRMESAFKTNPPKEYANDSKWPSYFEEASDNFAIMRARAVENKYGRAMQFCGMNCMLFVTINQTNGIDKTSDHLFMLRKVAKQVAEMAHAGNWNGAMAMLEHSREIEKKLASSIQKDAKSKPSSEPDLGPLMKSYEAFRATASAKDMTVMDKAFKQFLTEFAVIYPKYV